MNIKTLINNDLGNIFINIIDDKKIKLRKIEIPKLIQLLCELTNNSSPSFRDIALQYFIKFNKKISKVSFFNIMQKHIEEFLVKIIDWILFEKHTNGNTQTNFFERILIQDSTVMKLPDSAPEKYLGMVKKKGCKIQTYFDLLQNQFTDMEITPFNINDQKYSHEVKNVIKKNDLIIRDLGYFTIKSMESIDKSKAFFISKIQTTSSFYDEKGNKFDLLERLKTHSEIDVKVFITNHKLPVRIVARKLPEEVGNRRRQRKKADKKSNPSKRSLAILGWDILITNIFDQSINMETLFNLYKLRWKIEIIFKTWKSYCSLTSFHERISGKQVMIYTLCRLINVLFLDKIIVSSIFNKSKLYNYLRISYQSLIKNLSNNITHLMNVSSIEEAWLIVKKMVPYSLYEKRKNRVNLLELESITLNQISFRKWSLG